MTSPRRHDIFVPAALVVLLVAIYGRVTGFDFVIIDDNDHEKQNTEALNDFAWTLAAQHPHRE
jgi:hypothetical protein